MTSAFAKKVLSKLVLVAILIMPMIASANPFHLLTAPNAIDDAGDRLAILQNPDGGWFFTVGDVDCGAGPGISCPNTFGITALGLLRSVFILEDIRHWEAAQATADALVAKHAVAPACDANPGTSADRPFTVDLTFLVHFGLLANDQTYATVANAWFDCVQSDFPSAADRANNRINGRIAQGLNNLGAWDASLDIQAAVASGEKTYAIAEALQVLVRQPDWDVNDPDCPGCELLSKGLFIAATAELTTNATIRNARAQFVDDLLAAQDPLDGSWGGGDTQTTAYVVMGLDTYRGQGRQNAEAAIKKGAEFILSMQLPEGGFGVATSASGIEVTEVNSEAILALWAASSKGPAWKRNGQATVHTYGSVRRIPALP